MVKPLTWGDSPTQPARKEDSRQSSKDTLEDVRQVSELHEYHFKYNRRLSCYSHPISTLYFTKDANLLLSATNTGDIKVWDTLAWSEASKLRSDIQGQPRVLLVSPDQAWVVIGYPSALVVFAGAAPWVLEHQVAVPKDELSTVENEAPAEWVSLAFSPRAEQGRPNCHQLAAVTTNTLLTLDFSKGWSDTIPSQSRSLSAQNGRPSSLAYSGCGENIVCGFSTGQIQVWSASSLGLAKTLSPHEGMVWGLEPSPRNASFRPRLISCSADSTLRVWTCQGWHIEHQVRDLRCDRSGIRNVAFSDSGHWLLSVGTDLCIWRVFAGRGGRVSLALHQRLSSIPGGDGVRSVAFGCDDLIAIGSKDGVLGLLIQEQGLPPEPPEEGSVHVLTAGKNGSSTIFMRPDPIIRVRDLSLSRKQKQAARLEAGLRHMSGSPPPEDPGLRKLGRSLTGPLLGSASRGPALGATAFPSSSPPPPSLPTMTTSAAGAGGAAAGSASFTTASSVALSLRGGAAATAPAGSAAFAAGGQPDSRGPYAHMQSAQPTAFSGGSGRGAEGSNFAWASSRSAGGRPLPVTNLDSAKGRNQTLLSGSASGPSLLKKVTDTPFAAAPTFHRVSPGVTDVSKIKAQLQEFASRVVPRSSAEGSISEAPTPFKVNANGSPSKRALPRVCKSLTTRITMEPSLIPAECST